MLGVILCLKMSSADKDSVQEIEETDNDYILELVVDYAICCSYPPGLLKDKKRAVRKRAATLIVDNRKVFLRWKGRRVKVVTAIEDQ